ncbi:MAG: hypothetical protein ACC628_20905 [Pirellulaceae bacterium]
MLRNFWGQYLTYNPELPKTGFHQRSSDKAMTWGLPEVLMDPENGTIHVFSHIAGDNAYGNVDQAIVMDSFRLKVE